MSHLTIALRSLLALTTLQSTSFFLGALKIKIKQWLMFNSCAVANYSLLAALASSHVLDENYSRMMVHASLPGLMYYGGLGLVVFPWKLGMNLIPQFSHLIMSANVLMELNKTLAVGDFENAFKGTMLGLLFWLPFIFIQNKYLYSHQEEASEILWNPEERMKKMGIIKSE
ncbi:hypothetical protein NAEGRDRAFT_79464 [Naegleria gruberi]|uniref:Uncharacterized protein n=1 Tax=Naegleria gruberi TaxID=5762 RepID=D2VCT0_NAEGR|nr:uncharacterized protein NAEGRDRAFT_79464 [Naegleria gruberi]EFC45361.1 hypothetical protein NAEGRDRAFT_79464 [Naegleria gruberi]|eukprot:XP_002678105.1 hypothetical protein NAEGRDRAFT_79464 [Naegleria gruberi strain NEG-M]